MKLSTSTFNDVTECGLVSASAVYGVGLLTYIGYSFSSLFGCSSNMMEAKIDKAKSKAIESLQAQAAIMKADGVMGIKYQMSFLSVLVYGTVFKYNKEDEIPEI